MPHNLLKKYPDLLEIAHLSEDARIDSLKMIFNRDIRNNSNFCFRSRKINPVKGQEEAMEILFHHLTTVVVDSLTRRREFEFERSIRLHWIRHHIDEELPKNRTVFSVSEKNGVRTYIYDEDEKYVIILEPYRNMNEYYLITAYYLRGRNYKKVINKYKRRLPDVH